MAKLRSSTIEPSTGTTLALGASGDSILVSSDSIKANTWQDLGGNSLFVSNGSGTLSSVNSGLAGGGYTLILSQSASGSASIAFTADLDSTYDEYMFVMTNMSPASVGALEFQCSTDGGSNYNTTITSNGFVAWHNDSDATGLDYTSGDDQANGTAYQKLMHTDGVGVGSYQSAGIILHLFNPSNTTYVKQWYSTCSRYYQVGGNHAAMNDRWAGYFNTTSAINAISFKFASGNITTGTIQMYGVS